MSTPFLEQCMRKVIESAVHNAARGYFPYAAILTRGNEILSTAEHTIRIPTRKLDLPIVEPPSAHPETALVIAAFSIAQENHPNDPRSQSELLSSLTIVTNVEPCQMCIRAMGGAFIQRYVFAIDSQSANEASGSSAAFASNSSVLENEFGLRLHAIGPLLKEEAFESFEKVWKGVRALHEE